MLVSRPFININIDKMRTDELSLYFLLASLEYFALYVTEKEIDNHPNFHNTEIN